MKDDKDEARALYIKTVEFVRTGVTIFAAGNGIPQAQAHALMAYALLRGMFVQEAVTGRKLIELVVKQALSPDDQPGVPADVLDAALAAWDKASEEHWQQYLKTQRPAPGPRSVQRRRKH